MNGSIKSKVTPSIEFFKTLLVVLCFDAMPISMFDFGHNFESENPRKCYARFSTGLKF